MTGQELFERMRYCGTVNPATWEWATASDRTRELYTFIAGLKGPLTAVELYEKVKAAGLLVNDIPFKERTARFRTSYINLAFEISK